MHCLYLSKKKPDYKKKKHLHICVCQCMPAHACKFFISFCLCCCLYEEAAYDGRREASAFVNCPLF